MNKVKINTASLKVAVSKAIKGAGNNKFLPITSLMGIEVLEDGQFYLYTTDGDNVMRVLGDGVTEYSELFVTVPAKQFNDLISKTSCEEVILSLNKNVLIIKGNGTYKIPMLVDNGGIVVFPKPECNNLIFAVTVPFAEIKSVLQINKCALSKNLDSCLNSYFVGDRVYTTDADVICILDKTLFIDYNNMALLSSNLLNLTSFLEDEVINVEFYSDNRIVFTGNRVTIYGYLRNDVIEYPINSIYAIEERDYTNQCFVSKSELLSILSRLALFINPYDRNGIDLIFDRKFLTIQNHDTSALEQVFYKDSSNINEAMRCCVDINMFKMLVSAIPDDAFYINFSDPKVLKLSCKDVSMYMAAMLRGVS